MATEAAKTPFANSLASLACQWQLPWMAMSLGRAVLADRLPGFATTANGCVLFAHEVIRSAATIHGFILAIGNVTGHWPFTAIGINDNKPWSELSFASLTRRLLA